MLIATIASWAHLTATVAVVGYYVVLTLVVLPTLAGHLADRALEVIAAIERRAIPALVGSVVVFLATGIYLLTSDPRYGGPGTTGGAWASLLLVKHLVVIGMLAVGSYVDALMVRAAGAANRPDAAGAIARIRLGVGGMAALGLAVVLLTAIAQAT